MRERYRLIRHVATGGMAEVYLGAATGEEGFERPVAVKRLLPHFASNADISRMFLAEARLATHLQHQNIVQMLDVGRSQDGLYLVMEAVDGWDLNEVLVELTRRAEVFPAPLAAHVALQVATGLAYAYGRQHQGRSVVSAHRDVSPSNVLVSTVGEVKLADFGIAKVELPGAKRDTVPGTFKGKIAYAAPEVLSGQPASPAADQFGLGITLYEMLTAKHPFGEADQLMSYVASLQKTAPGITSAPPRLAESVGRMLQKDPAARYPSMDAVVRALAEYLATCGEPATSAELAAFLARLDLPPSFSQRAGKEVSTTSFSLSGTVPLQPIALTDAVSDGWAPAGPELDTSGELVSKPASKGESTLAPRAVPSQVRTPAPVDSLELARPIERPPPTERDFVAPVDTAPPARRGALGRAFKALLVLGIAGGVVAGIIVALPRLAALFPKVRALEARRPVLLIDSEPQGATLKINGEVVGNTPFSRDNLYPDRDIPFELSAPGHRPHKGTFRGGQEALLSIELKKR